MIKKKSAKTHQLRESVFDKGKLKLIMKIHGLAEKEARSLLSKTIIPSESFSRKCGKGGERRIMSVREFFDY